MEAYRDAGVDVAAGDRFVASISEAVRSTWTERVVGGFGGFAAGIEIPPGYTRPVLMMSTDGVGTKIEVAARAGLVSGLGFDLVAMCVDDLAATGAKPLGFTDYLATGRIDADRDRTIVESIAAACRTAGCALLGGETAEHPGVMDASRFDLAGAALGVVELGREVDGSRIAQGDVAIGVASPNLRSNGFSLIRRVFDLDALQEPFPNEANRSTAEVLTEPSVIYAPMIGSVLADHGELVSGLAHITGGGLPGNAARPVPPPWGVTIDPSAWRPPNVFKVVQDHGHLTDADMFGTFNMGVGFIVYSAPASAGRIIDSIEHLGHQATVIGQVTAGHSGVTIDGLVTDSA